MPQNQNIPILTDLIAAGNPKLKISEKDKHSLLPQSANLNMRIDEIETAIGQDKSDPIGRAFAIRAENKSNSTITTNTPINPKPSNQKSKIK